MTSANFWAIIIFFAISLVARIVPIQYEMILMCIGFVILGLPIIGWIVLTAWKSFKEWKKKKKSTYRFR